MTELFLDQRYITPQEAGAEGGGFALRLLNPTTRDLVPVRLCYTSIARPLRQPRVTGATFERTRGTYVALGLSDPLPAGGVLSARLEGLAYAPVSRAQGIVSAWVEMADGRAIRCAVGDLIPPQGADTGPVPPHLPTEPTSPLGLLPWPAEVAVTDWAASPCRFAPGAGIDPAPFVAVAALHRRLFPTDPAPLSPLPRSDSRPVILAQDATLPAEGYRLDIATEVTLTHADDAGLRHGLVALAQMAHAAFTDPRYALPAAGRIADAPRFAWRGCHFDSCRNFQPLPVLTGLLDILAWLRMNRFHWHLSEDEAWRLPSRAFQGLAGTADSRGRGQPIPPQHADGPLGQQGRYEVEDIAAIRAHAAGLGIKVMPEIEMPGHARALIEAVPGLEDPDEPADSYRSIQGYGNNALNPGLPRTYEVAATLLSELADSFPEAILHVGADEVAEDAWHASPAAQALAAREGLTTAAQLQAHFLRRIQGIVHDLGRSMGAWDEAADGGGIDTRDTVLFAWRSVEKTAELIASGYDVVATPGQAYYLDMAHRRGWDGFGISWAGMPSLSDSYAHDPGAGLPDGPGRLLGVQGCIWTEYLPTPAHLNAMVFPRLAAVAEAGWTPQAARDFARFAPLATLVPRL